MNSRFVRAIISDDSMAAFTSDRIGKAFAGFILLPKFGAMFGLVGYFASVTILKQAVMLTVDPPSNT